MARRGAGGSPRARHSADSASIFLCMRFASGYFTRKFRQCPPRKKAPSGPATRSSPRSRSSATRRATACAGSAQASISRYDAVGRYASPALATSRSAAPGVVRRTRPAAELLAVIHEHGEGTARLPQLTEVGADLRRRPEGNEIAEPLIDRKQPDALAAALGQERRMEPVPLEAAHEKMPVVHEQIPYARIGQVGGQIGLPHPLGEPQAGRLDAEAAPDRFTHPADLLESIRTHQRREHRLVESRQQQLDVPVRRQATDRIEVGASVRLEPFEQRSRDVQRERQEPLCGEPLHEGEVHVSQVVFEDVVEVPHRLVEVHAEHEPHWIHQMGTPRAGAAFTPCRYSSRPVATAGSLLGARARRSSRPASSRAASVPASSIARAAERSTISDSSPAMSSKNQPQEVNMRSAWRSSSSSSRARASALPSSGRRSRSPMKRVTASSVAPRTEPYTSRTVHGSAAKMVSPSRSNIPCSSAASQSSACRNGARQRCCVARSPCTRQPQSDRQRSTPCGQLHALGATSFTSSCGACRARNAAKVSTRTSPRLRKASSTRANVTAPSR